VEKSLDAIVRQLENQLTVIAEGVNRVQIFKTRLVNQRPQLQGGQEGNPKGVNPPTPGSIEGRLNYLSSVAGHIGEMLHEVAADLDRAA
jgi:hypothetical protein